MTINRAQSSASPIYTSAISLAVQQPPPNKGFCFPAQRICSSFEYANRVRFHLSTFRHAQIPLLGDHDRDVSPESDRQHHLDSYQNSAVA